MPSSKEYNYASHPLSATGLVRTLVSGVALALAWGPSPAHAADVTLDINTFTGRRDISPLIYGVNKWRQDTPPLNVGSRRLGGSMWETFNWERNFTHNDEAQFPESNNDRLAPGDLTPGAAVLPWVQETAASGSTLLLTVPINGYVAADKDGAVSTAETAPSPRFLETVPKHPTGIFPAFPNVVDQAVYTDEYVHFVETYLRQSTDQEIHYLLGNEPGIWDTVHPRTRPGGQMVGMAELRTKTIAHASAVKDVHPDAVVYGPVASGWIELHNLHGAPDFSTYFPGSPPQDEFLFLEWYLNEISVEESRQGRGLIDVVAVNFYSDAEDGRGNPIGKSGALDDSPAVVAARVQAARSLWDPTYVEESFITRTRTNGEPVVFLDRVRQVIDRSRPGTPLALTEYNFGGGNHISGAIAQADALGIFGREGLHQASWWRVEPGPNLFDYTYAAFDAYLNFDGQGGRFLPVSVDAASSDLDKAAVYASIDPKDPTLVTLVVINRDVADLVFDLNVTHSLPIDWAELYQITEAGPQLHWIGNLTAQELLGGSLTLPGMSVTTLVLHTVPTPGSGAIAWAVAACLAGRFGRRPARRRNRPRISRTQH